MDGSHRRWRIFFSWSHVSLIKDLVCTDSIIFYSCRGTTNCIDSYKKVTRGKRKRESSGKLFATITNFLLYTLFLLLLSSVCIILVVSLTAHPFRKENRNVFCFRKLFPLFLDKNYCEGKCTQNIARKIKICFQEAGQIWWSMYYNSRERKRSTRFSEKNRGKAHSNKYANFFSTCPSHILL